MAKQRMIRDSFWTDPYIEKLTPDEKLAFIYLLTNPLNNVAGAYEIRTKRMAFELGFDVDIVDEILRRFERDKKILKKDDFIVIINHLKNQNNNPSIVAGAKRIFEDLTPVNRQAVTGWVQAGLLNLTLLNLTILNSAKAEDLDKDMNKQVQGLIKKRRDLKWSTGYGGSKKESEYANHLLGLDKYSNIVKVMEGVESKRGDKYLPSVSSLSDLYNKYPDLKGKLLTEETPKWL